MKLDEIARLAGVSRTTASYVINGKAKQYRVSDKTVESDGRGQEHNYHPNAVAAGLRAGRTRSIGTVIPDLENTSYTRIANYGTPGAPAWLPIADRLFRRSAGQRNALYRAPAAARWTPSSSPPPCRRSILSINAGPTIRCRSSRWTARWIASISSALWAPIRKTLLRWRRSCAPSRRSRCCTRRLAGAFGQLPA